MKFVLQAIGHYFGASSNNHVRPVSLIELTLTVSVVSLSMKCLNPQRPHFPPASFKFHASKFQIIIQLFSETNREVCSCKSDESYSSFLGVYNYFRYKSPKW